MLQAILTASAGGAASRVATSHKSALAADPADRTAGDTPSRFGWRGAKRAPALPAAPAAVTGFDVSASFKNLSVQRLGALNGSMQMLSRRLNSTTLRSSQAG